ncbi:MAG: D-alanyl-D-alanine carboxypeptidase/D-alanyl-D-alanine-endopeptidase [Candidatus Marinimicrobia bacterium]|nr:D-alanyl-D-alanine carboxypeptidase/D-alanyl-D-alanine-endopeptidase [Candidatus Neomarinimicrobiota bacterium]
MIKHIKNNLPAIVWIYITLFSALSAQVTITEWLNHIASNDTLSRAQWSIYAEYVDNGETIIDYNSRNCLAPASSLKIITTGLALVKLGPDFQFSTQLYYSSSIDRKGTLKGDLFIVGGGDPTLGSDMVPGSLPADSLVQTWIAAIKAQGIQRINGAIIADVSMLEEQSVPDYWPWIDIGNYYGTGTSALCFNDNLYYLTFKPGKEVGDRAEIFRVSPVVRGLEFDNFMRTGPVGSGDNGYIYCAPKLYRATLRGTIPAGVEEFTIRGSLPDPALFAAQYLSSALLEAGVKIKGNPEVKSTSSVFDPGKLVYEHNSVKLSEIVRITNQISVNLYTEQLLKYLAWKESGEGSMAQGLNLIETFLDSSGIDIMGWQLFDASGLSRTNRVSARQLSNFLSVISRTPVFSEYYNSFSIAGDPDGSGSVASIGKGTVLALNGRIKTGTIIGVRSHTGYLTTSSGRLVSFSLICNNYPVSMRRINKIHESILIQLVKSP